MDIKRSSKFLGFITMVGLLKFNIIEKIPFSVYLEIPCITFKTEKSFIAHPWIQWPLFWPWVYSLGMVSRYSTVRSGMLTWREWGLWSSVASQKPVICSGLLPRWPLEALLTHHTLNLLDVTSYTSSLPAKKFAWTSKFRQFWKFRNT